MRESIDLREAINAVSDVVMNRPRPIRVFDQIYMKTGDMVLQSEFIASWADGRRLAFIGDGDAISVCAAYLQKRGVVEYGPSRITVFDFDERIVGAVNRFADKERLENLDAVLYNCIDAFPADALGKYDMFYTNPPWGQHNAGTSVNVFAQRGMEAIGYNGQGMIVIADDTEEWAKGVLGNVQGFAQKNGFIVSRMMPRMHQYHLPDAPDLRSCNLCIASLADGPRPTGSAAITDKERLANFYGKDQSPRVRYVKEKKRLDYGMAHDDEFEFEFMDPK